MKIKNLLFAIILGGLVVLSNQTGFAQFVQCDRSIHTPIQCGYYKEGYLDGATDARANQRSDYRRYKNKLDSRYESFYSQGYDAGYSGVTPTVRWDNTQRDIYDRGFRDGNIDKRRNQSRSPERNQQLYNREYIAYYQKGYYDGYDGNQKQYDTDLGGNPTPFPTPFPTPGGNGRGTTTGTLSWSGRVDNRVNVIIQGNEVRNEDITGSGFQAGYQNLSGVLPRRPATISVIKRDGRGDVFVLQQPTRDNNYTAIVQIYDDKGGADNYRLDISWTSNNTIEPYQRGKITWRGRVDQTVNISIAGNDVDTQDISTGRLSNVNFNINGYLARRVGTVSVRKLRGRGTVRVVEQPNENNDYTAVIQVFDPDRGDDDYELEVSW